MSFFLYYIFHALLGIGILVLLGYLLKKVFVKSSLKIKILSLLIFIVFSNTPLGKYGLGILFKDIGSYSYQPCSGNFGFNSNVIEHKWRDKQALLADFDSHEKTYHRENLNDVLYRTFDFKWWMFWEYYTYYTTDVYELPLLPEECKKMN